MTLLNALIILALVMTVISLGWGVGSMAYGRQFDVKHSNHLMSARVILQGIVVVLMLIAFAISAT